MQLFATYTFGQALLTVLELALLFLWVWLAVTVVIDVFRSHDLSGWAKAGWLVLIVLVPLLGVLVYIIARSDKMKAHQVSDERQQEVAVIAEVKDLRDRGILTDAEFQRITRQRQLSQEPPPSPDEDIAELESLKDRGLLTEEEFREREGKGTGLRQAPRWTASSVPSLGNTAHNGGELARNRSAVMFGRGGYAMDRRTPRPGGLGRKPACAPTSGGVPPADCSCKSRDDGSPRQAPTSSAMHISDGILVLYVTGGSWRPLVRRLPH